MSKTFVDLFMDYTYPLESPDVFLKWSAYSAVSAIMRDYFYLEKGPRGRVHPNLYVVLYGRSSALRKGSPVKIASSLVAKIGNTKVIKGRGTLPAILTELAKIETSRNGIPLKGASALLCSEELSAFVPHGSEPEAIKLLTDLYDYHDLWTNRLVTSGVAELKNVCLSLLSASNDEMFKMIYGPEAVIGGLLARTIIVTADRRRKINSGVNEDYSQYDPTPMVDHLKHIVSIADHTKSLPMYYSKCAANEYDSWYRSEAEIEQQGRFDKYGIRARLSATVEKVAMVISMCDPEFTRQIEKHHIEQAIDECLSLLKNYEGITMGQGKSPIADPGKILILELLKADEHILTRKTLLRRHWGEIDPEILQKVVDTFVENEILEITQKNKETAYRLTAKFLVDYKKESRK